MFLNQSGKRIEIVTHVKAVAEGRDRGIFSRSLLIHAV